MHEIVKNTDKPLISFAIVAFNQEKFIREAVASALAQTYSPLEIILSDDASTDNTYGIIEDTCSRYSGPHRVVLNRNEKNLGLAGHINLVMGLASGELIVGAAGDDVSLPHRTERIWRAWEDGGRIARSLYSAFTVINAEGIPIQEQDNILPAYSDDLPRMCREFLPGVAGATHAWHREVFEKFGPLQNDVPYEDRVIPFRSLLLGGIAHIGESLVLYRRHEGAITLYGAKGDLVQDYHRQRARHARNRLAVYRQWLLDIALFSSASGKECVNAIHREIARAKFECAMEELSFAGRLQSLIRALIAGVPWRYAMVVYLRCASRLAYDRWIRRHPEVTRNNWLRLPEKKKGNVS